MTGLRAITTVYSYYLPEVRAAIDRLTKEYPHDVFLKSVSPGLDDWHRPIVAKLVAAHADAVPGLAGFDFAYPTAGSEEGIREYLTNLATQGVREIIVARGDYEGYREVAKTRGLAVREVPADVDPRDLPPGHWFLSNPSARDGCVVPAARVEAILDAGHQLFYDLSYLGTTTAPRFDVSHPGIAAVTISFSKPFGLFYYRVGFTFGRQAIPALYANKWFKNVYGLLIAERILDEIPLVPLVQKYKHRQAAIVAGINRDCGMELAPSDVWLLARLSGADADRLPVDRREALARFRRDDGYRFCLTPYFEALDAAEVG